MPVDFTAAAGDRAVHNKALTASTVLWIDLGRKWEKVEVANLDGAAAVYFTVDGSTPTVGGGATFVLPAAIGALTVRCVTAGSTSVVKAISVGAPTISVTGV
jgi:hypothetical protein